MLKNLLSRRYISSSIRLMQEGMGQVRYAPRSESFDDQPNESPRFTPRYQRPSYESAPSQSPSTYSSPSTSSASNTASSSAINPFPEEVNQDYSVTSFSGASTKAFSKESMEILKTPVTFEEVDIRPDGQPYMSEKFYRRLLCEAFGVGGWCLIPRGPHSLQNNVLSRDYALYVEGRFISQARGYCLVQGFSNPALSSEAVRSKAVSRLCKDLGMANELKNLKFVTEFKNNYCTRNEKGLWTKKRF